MAGRWDTCQRGLQLGEVTCKGLAHTPDSDAQTMPPAWSVALVLPPRQPPAPAGPGGTPSALCRVEGADGEHAGCDCVYQLLTLAVASWGRSWDGG